jgi:multidrug efflux pump subunit AcrA (membrane-fusion protein)
MRSPRKVEIKGMAILRFLRSRSLWGLTLVGVIVSVGYFAYGDSVTGWIAHLSERAAAAGHEDHHHHHGHHDDESHEEEEPTIQAAVWTEQLEAFVDHPFPVVGEPLPVAVHLSRLADGRALSRGAVTLTLIGPQGQKTEARLDQASQPGVFPIEVTPSEAGTHQFLLTVESPELEGETDRVEFASIEVYANHEAAHRAEELACEEEQDLIAFLKEQQWHAGMMTAVVRPQELAEQLAVPGRVTVPRFSEAVVPPPVSGRVLPPPDGQLPRVGQKVEQGDVLAVIEPSVAGSEAVQMLANRAQLHALDAELATKQLDVEAKIKATQLDLDLAKNQHERLSELTDQGIMAGKKAIEAGYAVELAEARLVGLRAALDGYAEARRRLAKYVGDGQDPHDPKDAGEGLRVVLRSPIFGTVVKVHATAGELVSPDQPLFRIVDLGKLYIEAQVSEYDLAKVENSTGAGFRLSAYPDRLIPILGKGGGRLAGIGSVVDPRSRTVAVRYEVPNPDGMLRVGMFADVLIETDRRTEALAVPCGAVVDDDGEHVIFVQTGGESFQRRPVALGLDDGTLVEVRRGLAAGERVVVAGAYSIRLSMLSGSIPDHHHH